MTKTAKKTTKKTALTMTEVVALLTSTPVEGWSVTSGGGYVDADGEVWTKDGYGEKAEPIKGLFVTFERTVEDLHVTINLNVSPSSNRWDLPYAFRGVNVEGHTRFNGRTFTRRGVDVSSCRMRDDVTQGYSHEYGDVPSLLDGEWKRCEEAHARSKTMVAVPGLPGSWRITPAAKIEISAKLREGRAHSFMPSGFGTGYRVYGYGTRPRRGSVHAKALPPETAKFFGVAGTLYYETMDCD